LLDNQDKYREILSKNWFMFANWNGKWKK
jgi:hypothetical protein